MQKQPQTILLVEDDIEMTAMLRMMLRRENYRVLSSETTAEARHILENETVHLMLLDWMLPDQDGVSFAKSLRNAPENTNFHHLPIVLLTAKSQEEDKLKGFDAGVDDYVSKPFSLKELIARIQSLLKRAYRENNVVQDISQGCIRRCGLTINQENHTVYTDHGQRIHFGPTEFKLLLFFMRHPGRVFSREQLLDEVWGVGVYVDERTVDVHIRRLRRGLEPHQLAHIIRTVRGAGYIFES